MGSDSEHAESVEEDQSKADWMELAEISRMMDSPTFEKVKTLDPSDAAIVLRAFQIVRERLESDLIIRKRGYIERQRKQAKRDAEKRDHPALAKIMVELTRAGRHGLGTGELVRRTGESQSSISAALRKHNGKEIERVKHGLYRLADAYE